MNQLLALPLKEALKILEGNKVPYTIKEFPELKYRFPLAATWRVVNVNELCSGELEIVVAREQKPEANRQES